MRNWTEKPSKIQTMYMVGEGYKIASFEAYEKLEPYELDKFAEEWLQRNNHPVRSVVKAWRSFSEGVISITSINYAKFLLEGIK